MKKDKNELKQQKKQKKEKRKTNTEMAIVTYIFLVLFVVKKIVVGNIQCNGSGRFRSPYSLPVVDVAVHLKRIWEEAVFGFTERGQRTQQLVIFFANGC